jgi:hypothetical protein
MLRSLLRTSKGVARVRLEEKTGAKAIEIIAIIAVGSLVKTSLKPARDSDDKIRLQGVSYLPHRNKLEHQSRPREKTSAGFLLDSKACASSR